MIKFLDKKLNDVFLELYIRNVCIYFCVKLSFLASSPLPNRFPLSMVECVQFRTLSQDHKPKVNVGPWPPWHQRRFCRDIITLHKVSMKKALLYHELHLTYCYLVFTGVLWLALATYSASKLQVLSIEPPDTDGATVKNGTISVKSANPFAVIEQSDLTAKHSVPPMWTLQCVQSPCCPAGLLRHCATVQLFHEDLEFLCPNKCSVCLFVTWLWDVMGSFALG